METQMQSKAKRAYDYIVIGSGASGAIVAGELSKTGGSNHAYADGSARYIRYGRSLCPLNDWAVTEAGRTNFAICIYQ